MAGSSMEKHFRVDFSLVVEDRIGPVKHWDIQVGTCISQEKEETNRHEECLHKLSGRFNVNEQLVVDLGGRKLR